MGALQHFCLLQMACRPTARVGQDKHLSTTADSFNLYELGVSHLAFALSEGNSGVRLIFDKVLLFSNIGADIPRRTAVSHNYKGQALVKARRSCSC